MAFACTSVLAEMPTAGAEVPEPEGRGVLIDSHREDKADAHGAKGTGENMFDEAASIGLARRARYVRAWWGECR